jgi:hypothetical protein
MDLKRKWKGIHILLLLMMCKWEAIVNAIMNLWVTENAGSLSKDTLACQGVCPMEVLTSHLLMLQQLSSSN